MSEQRESMRDKTAVSLPTRKEPRYWENPRDERKPPKAAPFESQLQKDAIRRQKEAGPQSGHVEPQFFPAMGVVKGTKQTFDVIRGKLK